MLCRNTEVIVKFCPHSHLLCIPLAGAVSSVHNAVLGACVGHEFGLYKKYSEKRVASDCLRAVCTQALRTFLKVHTRPRLANALRAVPTGNTIQLFHILMKK